MLSLLHIVQSLSEAHTASCKLGDWGGGLSPEVNRRGHKPEHSPAISAEVKKTCVQPFPHKSLWPNA
jgi:hypothetical protein